MSDPDGRGRPRSEAERFAYIASHELQAPARQVIGFLRLLEESAGEALDDEAKRYLQLALHAGADLQRLLGDLLVLSRAATRDIEFAPVLMDEVARSVVSLMAQQIQESEATVEQEALPAVWGERECLIVILRHILDNAIRYHMEGKPPKITISAREQEDQVELAITDNGMGVPPHELDHIVQPFVRLQPKGTFPGSGAGLAIAERLVARHGGTLRVESEGPGTGTTVRLTLYKPLEGARVLGDRSLGV